MSTSRENGMPDRQRRRRRKVRTGPLPPLRTSPAPGCLWHSIIAVLVGLTLSSAARADEGRGAISVDELREHANVLASDTFEGREAGQRGGRAAGAYIASQLKRLGVRAGGDDGSPFQHFGSQYRNILALLPGSDDTLSNELLIVGAHYDHVGYGKRTNSFGPYGNIHNGADDNASGVAALLEIIEALMLREPRQRRSILFVFWDAEEKGMLGSKHWVANPTVSLENVRLVLNVDMIGRLTDDKAVDILGVRTAAGFRQWVARQNHDDSLKLHFNWNINADSDHYPFVQRRIPYIMPFTGKHDDYHRPTDDPDRLNLDGMLKLTRLLLRLTLDAANRDELPEFRPQSRTEDEKLRRQTELVHETYPSRLGVSWDWGPNHSHVVITGTAAESPASRAGLRPGDRVLTVGRFRTSVADFCTLVNEAPSSIEVTIERDPGPQRLQRIIRLRGKPVRLGLRWRVDAAEPRAVILTSIVPESPADVAGLMRNDRVYQVDGENFVGSTGFPRLIERRVSALRLMTERDGRIHERIVDLSFLMAKRAEETE